MIRLGNVTRFVLLNLYVRDAYKTAELPTRMRKAVRQLKRLHGEGASWSFGRAVQRFANSIEPGAHGVVVHVHRNGVAYEIEVIQEDGYTIDVFTVTAKELRK